ncbi:GlcNAc-transferase family protein [Tepidamorphus sp. 3E244]|uniref:GlcNAc-transferase family protein n=1 Tax=Tepidamorphus sp. 3E244 TaxID=3385498 RepID=UPI0038FC8884
MGQATGASEPTIFVSIASYCDPLLVFTLDSCLANARHPDRLRFGICSQNDPDAPVPLDRFRSDPRFAFSDHDYRQSKGGCWAREISQGMWAGETFVLQVDSHTAFAPNWDDSLVRMMARLPASKPLISMLLPLFLLDEDGQVLAERSFGLRATRVAKWQAEDGWAPWFDWGCTVDGHPCRNRFLSGGFVFTLGAWTEEVRQDPEHYYWGEEFALAVRSYTHGYDIFLPDELVAWHFEHREASPRRHRDRAREEVALRNQIAVNRLHALVFPQDGAPGVVLGRYALGTARSLSDYEAFAGMDLTGRRAHPDIFEGVPNAGDTIKGAADWAQCIELPR